MSSTTTTPVAGYLATGLYQLGYVTNDVDRAVESLRATLGLTGLVVGRDVRFDEERYQGRPSASRQHIALGAVGQHHVEVIQPLEGENPYWDILGEDYTLALHHLGVRVAHLGEVLDAVRAGGKEPVYEGSVADGAFRFAYVDYRPELGHLVEFLETTAEGGAYMERVTRGEISALATG
jgi:hypothetical protein